MKNRLMSLFIFFTLVLSMVVVFGVFYAHACTVAGVTGEKAGGDVFFGQTMDNPWWPTRHTLWVIQPECGYKYIGTKAEVWGLWTGMNEAGFGWVGAFVESHDKPDPNGIDRFKVGPLLLENAKTVKEAIQILERTPRSRDFPTRNALMGDALGNLALVEISYEKTNVYELIRNGYIVATNHSLSGKIKGFGEEKSPESELRYKRGTEWFEERKNIPVIHPEDMFDFWSYVYMPLQNDPVSGPGTGCLIQPKEQIYWFTYGWPGGNLPTPDLEKRQICQNMTWGVWIPFHLSELPPGQYTTELGQLTPLGMQYLYSHFHDKQQRSPAWFRYQSIDPMKPYYKPAEEMLSPSGYTPKENPYGPGGMLGQWTPEEGFKPYENKK